MSDLLKYILQIVVVCSSTFVLHITLLFLLNKPLFANQIITAYVGNTVLAIVIVTGLLIAMKKHQDSLGFLFLFGSLLKFIFFFFVFYSDYKADGFVQRTEFLTFFIPYVAALIIQTKCLIDKLSK